MRSKKIVLTIMCTILAVLSLIHCFVYADDDNGSSGTGVINKAYYSFYRWYEYGWRVSLYIAKDIGLSEEEYKNISLIDDCYYLGYYNIVNQYLTVTDNILWGNKNKIQYITDGYLELKKSRLYKTVNDSPAVPIVGNGDISTVNSYFRQNTTVLKILGFIAEDKKVSSFDLVKNLTFTYHYTDSNNKEKTSTKTGEEWGENLVLPKDQRENVVPWVIVYEPLICTYLGQSAGTVILTATEYAMLQGIQYNWTGQYGNTDGMAVWEGVEYYTGNIHPEYVQSLVFKNLPASVMLAESWFGYGTISKTDGSAWSVDDIIDYGGWGMGFLSNKNPTVPIIIDDPEETTEETEETNSPEETSEPEETTSEPEETSEPEPEETGSPEETTSPEPEETSKPEEITGSEPEGTSVPEETGSPEGTSSPEPEETNAPEETSEPEETSAPNSPAKNYAELEITPVTPNSAYRTGTEVISSFKVRNTSENDLYPGDGVTVSFTATDANGKILATETSAPLVLPAGEDTFVWFRWTVSANGGTKVSCTGSFNTNGNAIADVMGTSYSVTVSKKAKSSHTPAPELDDKAPYKPFFVLAHKTSQDSNSWYDWSFDGTNFVKNVYTAKLGGTLTVSPDRNITYLLPKEADGTPIMRSGYGVELVMSTAIAGNYSSDAVVMPQTGYFIFPEFSWSTGSGKFETAEKTDYGFTLPENPDGLNRRIHYTPLWFPDGEDIYYSIINMSDCWTPAGMLESEVASNRLTIDGCVYDGYFITHPK